MSADVAVIGAGPIGAALADAWRESGLRVVVGRRSPAGDDVSPLAAAIAAPVVVAAVPAAAVAEVARLVGDIGEPRLVLDPTNRLSGPPTEPGNFRGPLHQREVWRREAPQAIWFRAFSTASWETLASSRNSSLRAVQPFCGPAPHRGRVAELIERVGMQPAWFGDDEASADDVDGVARAWFRMALVGGGGRELALSVG